MNDNKDVMRKVRANNFIKNNGVVLRAINIVRRGYNRMTDVQQATECWQMREDEFVDCINFLSLAKYIDLRTIDDKTNVPDIADVDWRQLEVRLSETGIRLVSGKLHDEMVEV
ncbi:MAG: type VI secretion protein [Gemmiger formicilis]|nr:type VI secretion protein [Gemmiger formicilis]